MSTSRDQRGSNLERELAGAQSSNPEGEHAVSPHEDGFPPPLIEIRRDMIDSFTIRELKKDNYLLTQENEILKQRVRSLMEESIKERNDHLEDREKHFKEREQRLNTELETLKCSYSKLLLDNESLRTENRMLVDRIRQLEKCNDDLQANIRQLSDELTNVKEESRAHIAKIQQQLNDVNSRDKPITARQAMTTLEGHMLIDMFGSKTAAKKARNKGLRSVFEVDQRAATDPGLLSKLQHSLQRFGLEEDDVYVLADIKDRGDDAAHYGRTATIDDLRSILEQKVDQEDVPKVRRLLSALVTRCPRDPTTGAITLDNPAF